MRRWKDTLPRDWNHETVHLADAKGTVETHCGKIRPYEAQYSVFGVDHVATGWTNYFVSRILLGEVLLTPLKPTVLANGPGAAVLRNTCVAARWDMHQEAREICATVPFFLGLGPRTKTRCWAWEAA